MRFKLTAALLLIANIAVLYYSLSLFGLVGSPADSDPSSWRVQHWVQVGGSLDDSALAALRARTRKPWTHLMIAVADVNHQDAGLAYLQVIRENLSQLECLVVAEASQDRLAGFLLEIGAELPNLADPAGDVRRALGFSLEDDSRGVLIIDSRGVIGFFSPYILRPDYLRQLAEKHAVGEIGYAYHPDRFSGLFQVGDALPRLTLLPVLGQSRARREWSGPFPSLVLFISPSAQTCRMQALSLEVSRLRRAAGEEGRHFQVVFGSQFPAQFLGFRVQHDGLPADTFRLGADSADYSSYSIRTVRQAPDMIAVWVDPSGKIQQVDYPGHSVERPLSPDPSLTRSGADLDGQEVPQ